jgi:hypothetical protein
MLPSFDAVQTASLRQNLIASEVGDATLLELIMELVERAQIDEETVARMAEAMTMGRAALLASDDRSPVLERIQTDTDPSRKVGA